MSKMVDLTGRRFGHLTVLSRADDAIQPSGQRKTQWLCKCDCGNSVIVQGLNLRTQNTKSCGCIRSETTRELGKQRKIHGLTNTRLMHIWNNMKQRCENPSAKAYCWYGAKGISVCEAWRSSFQTFYDWAMANGYRDNLSIDRIDPSGNYEPSNCRWATDKEQHNNQSSNKNITYEGETKSIAAWAEEYGIKYSTLSMRLKRGWSVDAALTKPINKTNKRVL